MSKTSQQAGEALARVFAAHGVRCDRERAADIAALLLSLVERGLLVPADQDPVISNTGSSIQESPGGAS
ncbi:MAG: hypothetical protein Q8K89_07510 [Actinomycetota bacterium]|nr:hypothetical protein [Actinomycetota bacterium]